MIVEISEELLHSLPEDPEQAFVAYEKLVREALAEDKELTEAEYFYTYAATMLSAARAYNIAEVSRFELPSSSKENNAATKCQSYVNLVLYHINLLRLRHLSAIRKFSVKFDATAKEKLRHLLNQMKETLDKTDLPSDKKDRIFTRISDLEKELERERTRFEHLGALVVACSDGLGKMVDDWMPRVEKIGKIFQDSKDQEDKQRPQLPGPKETKKLEPPKSVSIGTQP